MNSTKPPESEAFETRHAAYLREEEEKAAVRRTFAYGMSTPGQTPGPIEVVKVVGRTHEEMSSLARALSLVVGERARQDKKWGSQRHLTTEMWLKILVEEIGEVAKADLGGDMDEWRKEMTQVATVAVCALECWASEEAVDFGGGPVVGLD
jgi:NTP pyrophosphatase (non-canonical NTP hydrolase)